MAASGPAHQEERSFDIAAMRREASGFRFNMKDSQAQINRLAVFGAAWLVRLSAAHLLADPSFEQDY